MMRMFETCTSENVKNGNNSYSSIKLMLVLNQTLSMWLTEMERKNNSFVVFKLS